MYNIIYIYSIYIHSVYIYIYTVYIYIHIHIYIYTQYIHTYYTVPLNGKVPTIPCTNELQRPLPTSQAVAEQVMHCPEIMNTPGAEKNCVHQD